MDVFGKIKVARKLLGLTQKEISVKSGILQKDISLIESGKKHFIPNRYIYFLVEKGIDLNSLFDNSETATLIKGYGHLNHNLNEPSTPYNSRDTEEVVDLNIIILNQTKEIFKLREAIEQMRAEKESLLSLGNQEVK